MSYKFYSTYLELFEDCEQAHSDLKAKHARDLVLLEEGKTAESVQMMARSMRKTTPRPQRLLHDDENYYVTIDLTTSTYYVCYKTLMMVDIDFYKKESGDNQQEIIEMLTSYSKEHDCRFKIYRSRNGAHAFLTSKESDYKDPKDLQMMLDLGCDFYYTVYSNLRGWAVRLNRKLNEDVMKYTYICDIGDAPAIPLLEQLTELHINLVPVFQDVEPCLSYGK